MLAMDNLVTHKSETAMRIITRLIGYEGDLGEEGKEGILKSVATGKKFLTDKSHRIRFVFPSRHASCKQNRHLLRHTQPETPQELELPERRGAQGCD